MKARILFESEYERLRMYFKDRDRPLLDAILLTGLQYYQLIQYQSNPRLFPDLRFSNMGKAVVPMILTSTSNRYPGIGTWTSRMTRACIVGHIPPIRTGDIRMTWKHWLDNKIKNRWTEGLV